MRQVCYDGYRYFSTPQALGFRDGGEPRRSHPMDRGLAPPIGRRRAIIFIAESTRRVFAPDFTLDTLQGEQVKLSSLRGKVIVVNFWTTWCPPCRAETPALERSYEAYKDLDVVILGVNLTDQDSLKEVESFVQEFGLTYPILLDRDGAVGLLYQLSGLPTTFFINREGIIRTIVIGGPMSETSIRSKIEALLKEVQ